MSSMKYKIHTHTLNTYVYIILSYAHPIYEIQHINDIHDNKINGTWIDNWRSHYQSSKYITHLSLQLRHGERDGLMIVYSIVYSRRRLKKTSKLRVSGLCEGKSLVTDEFPAQRASHAKMFPFDDVIMYNRNSNIGKYTSILKQPPLSQITVDMRRAVMYIPFKNK